MVDHCRFNTSVLVDMVRYLHRFLRAGCEHDISLLCILTNSRRGQGIFCTRLLVNPGINPSGQFGENKLPC